MLQFLLDTDHLTLFLHGHSSVVQHVRSHTGAVGSGVVDVEEILRGRLAQVARAGNGSTRILSYGLFAKTVLDLTQLPIVPYDQSAEDEFQQLRSIRVGRQDLKIASIALANQLIVVTRNRRDFARVPGLTIEDWSV
jgi:tRNA(fMet)-specific endonuclease VapC